MLSKPAWWQMVFLAFIVPAAGMVTVAVSKYASADDTRDIVGDDSVRPRKIVIIRHAQSTGNIIQRFSTHPANPSYFQAPLTATGHEQAHHLGQLLKKAGFTAANIAGVITSPLPRAVSTAQIVADEIDVDKNRIVFDDRLIERDQGLKDGLPYHRYQAGDHWYPEHPESFGGETSGQVQARMLAAWERAVAFPGDGHILLVSHGQPIHSLTDAVTGQGHRIKNAEFVEVYADGNLVNEAVR